MPFPIHVRPELSFDLERHRIRPHSDLLSVLFVHSLSMHCQTRQMKMPEKNWVGTANAREPPQTPTLPAQLRYLYQNTPMRSLGNVAVADSSVHAVIQETVNANDVSRFHQIRQSIANAFALRSSPSKGASSRNSYGFMTSSPVSLTGNSASAMQAYSSNSTTAPRDYRVTTNGHRTSQSYTAANPVVLMFKPSPFYHIMNRVSDVRTCEGEQAHDRTLVDPASDNVSSFLVMQQHRHSISIPVKISDHATLEQCLNDKSCRIMIFSAADSSGVQDIAFPHQSELRVNGDEIKANLRGLKNKPGSTKPADITHALRIKTNYPNNVEFIYALTTKAGSHRPRTSPVNHDTLKLRHVYFLVPGC